MAALRKNKNVYASWLLINLRDKTHVMHVYMDVDSVPLIALMIRYDVISIFYRQCRSRMEGNISMMTASDKTWKFR